MLELHALPGRIRVKDYSLYKDKALSQYMQIYCENLYGVRRCHVNSSTATILIEYDEEKTTLDLILDNLKRAMKAALYSDRKDLQVHDAYFDAVARRNKAKKWFLIYGITYLLFKIKQAMYGKFSISRSVRVLEVASLVTIVSGYPLLKRIYKKFAKRIPTDSDILLQLTAAAFTILRESAKGVLVLVLKELSDFIKYSADVECMRAFRQSMGEKAGMVCLLENGHEVLERADQLCLNDRIVVHKGEIIAADGEVIDGTAFVNSLYYIGQPLVEQVAVGSLVFDGMTILSGCVTVRVTKLPETAGKANLPENELVMGRKVKGYAEKMTYASFGLAAVSYLMTRSILGAMSVMLVMSPSATGTALSSGMKHYIALLNQKNIYVRNPNVFEKLVNVNHIVFDKTGTLTYGTMKIRRVKLFGGGYTEQGLLNLCAACEADQFHPIAVTLKKGAEGRYDAGAVQSSVLLPSKGIAARYGDQRILIGNSALMREYEINIAEGIDLYTEAERRLYTPVFVAAGSRLIGMLVLQDILRDDAPELIRRLKARGMNHITLLTGDGREKARQTASLLGIKDVYGGCNAEDKVDVIRRFQKDGVVMMIGDGVNDVSSMKEADVSVSFVNASCDKVKLHSDCIIFEDNLTSLSDLISVTRKSYRRIGQSIKASNAFNFFFGALACWRYMDPFAAKSINTVNSLTVLLLNQRINFLSPGKIHPEHQDTQDMEEDDFQ